MVLAGTLTAAYQFVDNNWATDAGIEEGRKRQSADDKPALEAGIACNASLERQNAAVAALGAESKAKQARAAKGLADATTAAVGAIREADRLRGLAKAGSAAGGSTACPAGDAVGEVRRGIGGTRN